MNGRRHNDDPIRTSEEDELERSTYYDALHKHCTEAHVEEGLTIGVMGPWGSGKTSCLNILEKKLKEDGVAVRLFNPWLWEDEKQLLGHLLEVIGDMAKEEGIQDIGKDMWRYRRALAADVMRAVAGAEVTCQLHKIPPHTCVHCTKYGTFRPKQRVAHVHCQ